MSYNITGTKILGGSLRIDVNDLLRLRARDKDKLPKSNFVDIMAREMPIPSFWWSGDWSGHRWDWFLSHVVPCLRGKADVLFIWANGNHLEGLRIEDGKHTKCSVGLVPQ